MRGKMKYCERTGLHLGGGLIIQYPDSRLKIGSDPIQFCMELQPQIHVRGRGGEGWGGVGCWERVGSPLPHASS